MLFYLIVTLLPPLRKINRNFLVSYLYSVPPQFSGLFLWVILCFPHLDPHGVPALHLVIAPFLSRINEYHEYLIIHTPLLPVQGICFLEAIRLTECPAF